MPPMVPRTVLSIAVLASATGLCVLGLDLTTAGGF